jgi:hypothetical protein
MAAIIRRLTLAADTMTPLPKPGGSDYMQVDVSNAGTSVLFLYSGDTPVEDVDNFLKIAPGASRLLRFRSRSSTDPIVYLKSASGGEVVLVWG